MKLNKMVAISENGFVFDAATGDSYSLNPIGVEIIGLLKEGKSKEEIKNLLQSEYDVNAPTLEKSIEDFFSSLKNFNIIEFE